MAINVFARLNLNSIGPADPIERTFTIVDAEVPQLSDQGLEHPARIISANVFATSESDVEDYYHDSQTMVGAADGGVEVAKSRMGSKDAGVITSADEFEDSREKNSEDEGYEEGRAEFELKNKTTMTEGKSAKVSTTKKTARKVSTAKSYTKKTFAQKSSSIAKTVATTLPIRYDLPRCEVCIDRQRSCTRTDGITPCAWCADHELECIPEKPKKGPNPRYGRDKSGEKNRVKKD